MNAIRFSILTALLATLSSSLGSAQAQDSGVMFYSTSGITPCNLQVEPQADGSFLFEAQGTSKLKFRGWWPKAGDLKQDEQSRLFNDFTAVDQRPDFQTLETLRIYFGKDLQPTGYVFSNKQSGLRSKGQIGAKSCFGLIKLTP